jgi:hypothetical protein
MSYSLWDTLHEDLQNKIIKIRDDELEYDTKLVKLSNDFIRQYINDYMSSKGRRITNLQKATKSVLFDCFKKFNIPKIPYDIVVKDKEKKEKEVVNSKSKFEIGKYWCKYDNHFDGDTTTYHLWINITKITKCYIWVDIKSQYGKEFFGKIWKNKCDMSEYIKFSIFTIWSDNLRPY